MNLNIESAYRRIKNAPVRLKVARAGRLLILVQKFEHVATQNLLRLQGGPRAAQTVANDPPVEFLGVRHGRVCVTARRPADLRRKWGELERVTRSSTTMRSLVFAVKRDSFKWILV